MKRIPAPTVVKTTAVMMATQGVGSGNFKVRTVKRFSKENLVSVKEKLWQMVASFKAEDKLGLW